MNRAKAFSRSRLILLVALLAVLGVTLSGPAQPAAVAACPDGANVVYYSDASHTTQVGRCWHNCCKLWTCTGQLTSYYTVFMWPCDFN